MIYTDSILKEKYNGYSNLTQKITLEAKKGTFSRIKKGIYSDNVSQDGPALANYCYGPSYISFEYALAYYDLIPEYVSVITSATMGKKKSKRFESENLTLEYHSIPRDVFPYETTFLKTESGYGYRIATKEKALCDQLYSKYPVRSIKNLKVLLFDDLRIDEEGFSQLNQDTLLQLCPLYHCSTLNVLEKYLRRKKQ